MAANSPHPSDTNEKASGSNHDLPSTKKGFFSRKANKADSNGSDEKSKDTAVDGAPAKQIPPASFSSLFRSVSYPAFLYPFYVSSSLSLLSRFATKFELTINAIGLVAAAASGASQVRYPLFLCPLKLTNRLLLSHSIASSRSCLSSSVASPKTLSHLVLPSLTLRKVSKEPPRSCPRSQRPSSIPLLSTRPTWCILVRSIFRFSHSLFLRAVDIPSARCWHVCMHLHVHGCLGVHRRGWSQTSS